VRRNASGSAELRGMRNTSLVCELHAHTTWSDGALSVTELVDVYGAAGFDVLAVTDHIVRSDDPYLATGDNRFVTAEDFPLYLAEIEREAERAAHRYGLLVIPGAEISSKIPTRCEQHTPSRSACARSSGSRTGSRRRWRRPGHWVPH
jgi:histidinol phosphatase-like PHP family hydrolase